MWGLQSDHSTSTLAADSWPREALLHSPHVGHMGKVGRVLTLQRTGHIMNQRPTAIGSDVPEISATLKPFCAAHRQ